MKRKIKKLLTNPNRFFFDYFAKRLGTISTLNNEANQLFQEKLKTSNRDRYEFDEKVHPWVQLATQFNLRTGATTGHPDQSMLVNARDLLDVLLCIFSIAENLKTAVRIYTLGGGVNITMPREALWRMAVAEDAYKKIQNKPDFVVEFIGEFDNNFAAHFFPYYIDPEGLIIVSSNRAHIKKLLPEAFDEAYPKIINEFGNWAFGSPWPVDVVYTWVNKDDPKWYEMWCSTFPETPINLDRFASKDELKYSLRALSKNMPWVHKIYIVSNCSRPAWLKDHSRLKWIDHNEIFPDKSALPTFNSHAIEACLHKIPELNEHFIYFNDDILVTQPCNYYDFFDESGRSVSRLEPYGMVLENNNFDITRDYLSPSINSQTIIHRIHPPYTATRLHQHTPYALRRSTLEEIEETIPTELNRTRNNKTRASDDINLPSFFYHHYAIATGRAILKEDKSAIIRPTNINSLNPDKICTYKFLCFNDGDGSANDEKYIKDYKSLITKPFPMRCSFELSEVSWCSVRMSKTIMAYKTRAHRVPYIRKMIGDAKVSLDDGRWGLWENSKRCWLSYSPSEKFHLVIQDDSLLASNFYQKLDPYLKEKSDKTPYSLFFRFKNKRTHENFNEAARRGLQVGGFSFNRLQFGAGLIIPTECIDEMIRFADALDPVRYQNIDDLRFSKYFDSVGVLTYYPLPSLVDQLAELDSVNGNVSNRDRIATWFADGKNGFINNKNDQTDQPPNNYESP
jgi:hypothetical protein